MKLLTTAIDYTNGKPHIGHAYEKVITDVIACYMRLKGEAVFFLTGVDQHGQKVQQTAEKEGISPQAFVDAVTEDFIALWNQLGLNYQGWAATTDPRHKQCVQNVLQSLKDKGQLYLKKHYGHYSVRQEQFLQERDRDEHGNFGSEWGEVVLIEEENWYFKLSDHTAWLKSYLERTHDVILPAFRKAELLNALERNSELDLCISRPKERLHWGIEFPFDSNYVTYVWFDALLNYLSFIGYESENDSSLPDFKTIWGENQRPIHVIGKDILVPAHGIYWLCMLHAMGFEDSQMPQLLVHGWWNIRGEKMSKSLGNIIDPKVLAEEYGVDALRYYLCRDITTGKDADFDLSRLIMLYNTELANELGNLCNRALNMSQRFTGGIVEIKGAITEADQALQDSLAQSIIDYKQHMDQFQLSQALEAMNRHVTFCNGYAERMKPWEMNKHPDQHAQLATVLYHLVESLAQCTVMISPFLPEASQKLADQLQLPDLLNLKIQALHWGIVPQAHSIAKPSPIFPRIQIEKAE